MASRCTISLLVLWMLFAGTIWCSLPPFAVVYRPNTKHSPKVQRFTNQRSLCSGSELLSIFGAFKLWTLTGENVLTQNFWILKKLAIKDF